MRSALSAGWKVDRQDEPVFQAALGHALDFTTWRSLVRDHGLSNDYAVGLMVHFVADVSTMRAGTRQTAPDLGVPASQRLA